MWSYYGAKTNIIDHYPPPKFDKIIEPFAGSARYALKYYDRDIILVDKYEWTGRFACDGKDLEMRKVLPSVADRLTAIFAVDQHRG